MDDPVEQEAVECMRRINERHRQPTRNRAEALERARIAQDPREAPIQHGLWMRSGLLMLCDRCPVADLCEHAGAGQRCPLERHYVDTRHQQISRALVDEGHDPLAHEALVTSAVWAEIRLGRAMRQTAVAGEFTDRRDYTGVAKQIPALQRAVGQALADLNLTPHAIAKLEAQRAAAGAPANPLGSVVHDVDAQVVEAEFEEREEREDA